MYVCVCLETSRRDCHVSGAITSLCTENEGEKKGKNEPDCAFHYSNNQLIDCSLLFLSFSLFHLSSALVINFCSHKVAISCPAAEAAREVKPKTKLWPANTALSPEDGKEKKKKKKEKVCTSVTLSALQLIIAAAAVVADFLSFLLSQFW